MIKQSLYRSGSKCVTIARRSYLGFLILVCPLLAFPQSAMVVYDGLTGIQNVIIQNDSVLISDLIPKSPAHKSGIRLHDQIISINDSLLSGPGLSIRGIKDLLHDRAGKSLKLKIIHKGEEKPLTVILRRDPYLFQIDSYDFQYMVDSMERWDIRDIQSASLDTLFRDPLNAKITVYSVGKGSPAEKNGILPGDIIISLADEMDQDYSYHIAHESLSLLTSDTSITINRNDSLIYLPLEPSLQGDLMGIKSQFEIDFAYPCVWLKIITENRLSASRTYLFNVPEMKGKDSLNFFYRLPSGGIIEKKSGILIPVQERDFIYKDWHAVKVLLNKGESQTFYLRWKAEERSGGPRLQLFAHETIVRFDRFERMVLFGFIVTMLIISAFFLLLFAVMRKRQYLYFALYIGSLVIFLFISKGYLDEYFWKENNFFLKFLNKFQPYIMSWISIFFLLFGIAYLELRNHLKKWHTAVVIVLSLTGIRIFLVLLEALFNFNYPEYVDNIFRIVWIFTVGILPLFILIIPAILRLRNGYQPAWYFLVANLVLIPLIYLSIYSSIFYSSVLSIYESIFSRLFISSSMFIAAMLQILIFSYGIIRKMRLDELENIRIQKQIIDQLKVNEKLKDKVNRELEQKVKERTREISEQKEEIQSQRDEIEGQRDMVFAQKKEITDSIDYAQRIQEAVLPRQEYLNQILPEYFVFFKPKDVVSGDFYWIREVHNSLIVVAADCTGHGVPGAFMSMLGITLLNEQLAKNKLDDPGEILDNLRSKVKEMLVQQGETGEQKDGMDMSIAIIHKEKKELQFAGANNPLFLIRNSSHDSVGELGLDVSMENYGFQLFEYKGDRQPIGFYWEESKFTSHRIHLKENDTVYVFSDGFIDQFGGESRKKFKNHRFKELLLSIQKETMDRQNHLLENAFENWRGNVDQIDDVCIIGVRI